MSAIKTPESKGSFPAAEDKEDNTVNGPRLDSHKVQIQFPEIFSSGDSHLCLADHLIPCVIALVVFDDFIGREEKVGGVKCACRLLQLGNLFAFSLD